LVAERVGPSAPTSQWNDNGRYITQGSVTQSLHFQLEEESQRRMRSDGTQKIKRYDTDPRAAPAGRGGPDAAYLDLTCLDSKAGL
jgi:hypothetical protein